MSNSPLVDYTKISPNSSTRRSPILKITPHHAAGKVSVEDLGRGFSTPSRKASSNYGIGNDGRIGMYVEEQGQRAWTSNSSANDNQAITIEVSNCEVGGEWRVSDVALESLINLCVDICKRNNIEKLVYTGDSRGNLTRHNMFAATTCPGPYLQSKFPYIAEEVNKRLEGEEVTLEEFKKLYNQMLAEPKGDKPNGWAKASCEKAKKAKVFQGDGAGNYNWQDPVSREALASILDRTDLL